jgi:hypothetical protein
VNAATIGLLGVVVGSVMTFLGSVVVPWIRDEARQRKDERAEQERERRRIMLEATSALLEYRQQRGHVDGAGDALARVGRAINQVQVMLPGSEQVVTDMLIAMLAMIQEPRQGIQRTIGEVMSVLNAWVRRDVSTEDLVSEVEKQAGLIFSEDRKTFRLAPPK